MPPAHTPSESRASSPPPSLEQITPDNPEFTEAISRSATHLASTLNPHSTQSFRSGQYRWNGSGVPAALAAAVALFRHPDETRRALAGEENNDDITTGGDQIISRQRWLAEWEGQNTSNQDQDPTTMHNQTRTRQSDETEDDLDRLSTAALAVGESDDYTAARRDLQRLERALQRQRAARNNLIRTGRAADLGAVPTASALRAYWHEEPNSNDNTGSSATTAAQHQDRISAQAWRNDEYNRPYDEAYTISHSSRQRQDQHKKTEAFDRVRNSIRYLSQLRHTGVEGGLQLARQLDLDSLYESPESNTPCDLPMHINSLPIPQYSSWLAPGMVWNGLQSTDRDPTQNTAAWAMPARRARQRAIFRHTLARRREAVQEEIDGYPASLMDSDRYLSDLLQDTTGRWGFSQESSSTRPASSSPQSAESDHWPVRVTIHSVNYDTMTLTGTMSASHMPEKTSPSHLSTTESPQSATSMSSYFTGEIVDFRRQPLETEPDGRNYRVGGLDIDASYWARLGPFRKEIEYVRNLRGRARNAYQQDSNLWNAFRKTAGDEGDYKESSAQHNDHPDAAMTVADSQAGPSTEREESPEIEDDKIMARCLGSARWLDEKVGKEWILMRWKERCFVNPTGQSPQNHSQTRRILTTTSSSYSPYGGHSPDPGTNTWGGTGTSWGLTISGFYYIALNRLTGEIDGLYYDPGSQPYQALRMVPEGMSMQQQKAKLESSDLDSASERTNCNHVCGCSDPICQERVGLKKWFPSMELR
ncbi:hypothetical protein LTR67_006999 [Exophiala xenobiotica]